MIEFGAAHAAFNVVKITVLSFIAASFRTFSSGYSLLVCSRVNDEDYAYAYETR